MDPAIAGGLAKCERPTGCPLVAERSSGTWPELGRASSRPALQILNGDGARQLHSTPSVCSAAIS